MIVNTEGKTSCKKWHTDDWGGYERVFPPEVEHIIGKDHTQQLERTTWNYQTADRSMASPTCGNLASSGNLPEVTVRLAFAERGVSRIAYFNWIWVHSRKENTAAQRAELAFAERCVSSIAPWSWNDLITYPTLY